MYAWVILTFAGFFFLQNALAVMLCFYCLLILHLLLVLFVYCQRVTYPGERVSTGGGCEVAVTTKTCFYWLNL